MTITLNGTTGITTPDVTSSGSLNIDASAPDDSLVVDASGNLGLGVTPSASSVKTFEIGAVGLGLTNRASGKISLLQNAYYNAGFKYASSGMTTAMYEVDNGAHYWYTAPSGTAGNAISFTQAMTLDSSGNLLVGTTSVGGTGTYRGLTIGAGVGSLGVSYDYLGVLYRYDSVNENGFGFWNTRGGASPTGGQVIRFYVGTSFTSVGSISTSTSSTSYNTSSDYRLKEDWVAVADASTRVNALKPVNFAWKVDGKRVDGFLAHELAEVVPEAVVGEKDAVELVDIKDEDGNVTGQEERPVYQGIDQSKLVPLLTAALQEALAKIDDLTARVSALEAV